MYMIGNYWGHHGIYCSIDNGITLVTNPIFQINGDGSKFKPKKGPQIEMYMFNMNHLILGLPNFDLDPHYY